MSIDQSQVEVLIKQSIPDAKVVIDKVDGTDNHFTVHVISPVFAGKERLEQHEMVHRAIEELEEKVFLSLQTSTP